MTRGIAKRQGRPAWESAPPRLRQSDIARPFEPAVHHRPGFFARIREKLLRTGRGGVR